jgi:site-specific recombinase XerD
VSEAIAIVARDLQLHPPSEHVRLLGKGHKERTLPLWRRTAHVLKNYLDEQRIDPRSASPVFVNLRSRQPLTRFGVRDLLAAYAAAATIQLPSLARKRVHPHVVRHTTAVHMLHADVDLGRVSEQLGHASATTTKRYTHVSLDLKRRALEACAPIVDRADAAAPVWKQDPDLLNWLTRL